MSEKIQGTATNTREKMLHRYNDGLHHKHNKNHAHYRAHFRTHPCYSTIEEEDLCFNESTGQIREFKLRKIRKRLAKGRIH